jgi:hypothetical protein
MEEQGEMEGDATGLAGQAGGEADVQVIPVHGYGLVAQGGTGKDGRKPTNGYAELVLYILGLPSKAQWSSFKPARTKTRIVKADDSWI